MSLWFNGYLLLMIVDPHCSIFFASCFFGFPSKMRTLVYSTSNVFYVSVRTNGNLLLEHWWKIWLHYSNRLWSLGYKQESLNLIPTSAFVDTWIWNLPIQVNLSTDLKCFQLSLKLCSPRLDMTISLWG